MSVENPQIYNTLVRITADSPTYINLIDSVSFVPTTRRLTNTSRDIFMQDITFSNRTVDEVQYKELKVIVYDMLLSVLEDESLAKDLTSDNNILTYWIPCFTHKSVNPNPGHNYERLEYFGDSAMKLSFRVLLVTRFSNKDNYLSEAQLSSLSNHYMSTESQSHMADVLNDQFNIYDAFRIRGPMEDNHKEDLLESIFGVIFALNDNNMTYCDEMIDYIIVKQHFDIDMKYAEGAPKSRVIQLFQSAGLVPPSVNIRDIMLGETVTSMTINDNRTLRVMVDANILPSGTRTGVVYVTAVGNNASSASVNLYDRAMDRLTQDDAFNKLSRRNVPDVQVELDRIRKEYNVDDVDVISLGIYPAYDLWTLSMTKDGIVDYPLVMKIDKHMTRASTNVQKMEVIKEFNDRAQITE